MAAARRLLFRQAVDLSLVLSRCLSTATEGWSSRGRTASHWGDPTRRPPHKFELGMVREWKPDQFRETEVELAQEVPLGKLTDPFAQAVCQTGRGTPSHMTANEVTDEKLGLKQNSKALDASDHASMIQLSNDSFSMIEQLKGVGDIDSRNFQLPEIEDNRDLVRVHYVRHGEDFLLGITGSRDVVEKIQGRIAQFLKTELHLDVGLTSHVHIESGSVLFLGMRIAGVLASKWPRRYSKELEKRRRSKARIQRLAQVRKDSWNTELKDLTLRAWAWALKKTKKDLTSWEAAEQVMFAKAQEVSRNFVFEKIEEGETRQSVERLLATEEEIFLNYAGMGIPKEILQAHGHLTRLLEKYLEKEIMTQSKIKNYEKESSTVAKTRRYGGFPMQILAPMEVITEKLRKKGILQPTKARPTTLTSMLNSSDEAIVSYFSSLAHGLLRYYRCSDNFMKVRRLVDYQVRWSALFTLGSKHKCSVRKVIVSYTRGPRVLNITGDVMAEFPSSPSIARMGRRFLPNIQQDAIDNILRSRFIKMPPRKVKKGQARRVQLREC